MRRVNVFLSYAHCDGNIAKEVRTKLADNDHLVWQDSAELLPGDTFENDIRKVLQTSDAYVVILTPSSLASAWVLVELGGAWIGGLKLFPVLAGTSPADLSGPIRQLSCCTIDEIESKLLPALAKLRGSLSQFSLAYWTDQALRELGQSATAKVTPAPLARSLSEIVADAMSPVRHVRRLAHTAVQNSSVGLRTSFLQVIRDLTRHEDPRIRGEAYYCLGYICTAEGIHACDEQFLREGLNDENTFVQACCANALGEFCPLDTATVEQLQETLGLNAYRTQSSEQVAQLVYYVSMTMRRDLALRQKDGADAS